MGVADMSTRKKPKGKQEKMSKVLKIGLTPINLTARWQS
jgi:hypothetical protein